MTACLLVSDSSEFPFVLQSPFECEKTSCQSGINIDMCLANRTERIGKHSSHHALPGLMW